MGWMHWRWPSPRRGFGLACLRLLWGQGWQWLPAGDRAHAQPGIFVVDDPGEVPAQLDHGGQLAALEISFADGCSGGFIDNEHSLNMGRVPETASMLEQAARFCQGSRQNRQDKQY